MDEVINETKESDAILINETETVEVNKETPTREDLKQKGWTASEIEQAEKRGMIPKKKEEEKQVEDKKEHEKEAEAKKEEVKPEPKKSVLPNFEPLTPEKEKAFYDAFGPGTPQRAMYVGMKIERQKRQQAERERQQFEERFKSIQEEVERLKSGSVKVEVDENGQEIDPNDKPLTRRELEEYEKQKEETRLRREQEINQERSSVVEAMKVQEEYATEIYPDYAETVGLAKEVMTNIDDMFPNKWEQKKVEKLMKDLQVAAANADRYGVDDYNAALIAYEIGKLHPNYGRSTNGQRSDVNGNLDPQKANGSHTPEKMKRIETNTQRRISSASVSGSGTQRTISANEMTINDFLKLNADQRVKFREKYPERYAEIARG